MHVVIADTSPIQYLHQLRALHLLPELFSQVHLPAAVAQELDEGRRRGHDVPEVASLAWLVLEPADPRDLPPVRHELGSGEAAALVLGLRYAEEGPEPPLLLIDDLDARDVAADLGLPHTGTLGVLLRAKEAALVVELRPLLDRLEALGFRLGAQVRRDVLAIAGEA